VDVEHSTGSEPRLAHLRKEERSLSARRTRLHNRIDFLRSGGGGDSAEAAQQLADLERQERELSDERRDLHERIEAAEARLSRADDA
jgi:chromosome segregation ATPase